MLMMTTQRAYTCTRNTEVLMVVMISISLPAQGIMSLSFVAAAADAAPAAADAAHAAAARCAAAAAFCRSSAFPASMHLNLITSPVKAVIKSAKDRI